MLRILILRGALVALPFVIWFVWRAWARRSGREMGSTPYPWLFAAGALLLGISLLGSALFRTENRGDTYVPGEVTAGGQVSKGHFEQRASPPR